MDCDGKAGWREERSKGRRKVSEAIYGATKNVSHRDVEVRR